MKKIKTTLSISLLFFGLFFTIAPVAKAEVIREFNSTINVLPDSSLLINEKITYDFEKSVRHGIFRTIPLKNSKNEPIEIEVVSVINDLDKPYQFTTDTSEGILNIKIGDPDRMISGIKEYNISYQVFGAIAYYDQFDEIYWNVTGNDWPVPILKSETKVVLPNNVFATRQACYYGEFGSKTSCQIDESNTFSAGTALGEGEGLTIAVGFPKGVVSFYQPKVESKILRLIKIFWPIIIPVIVFVVMFRKWWKKGRDPKGRGVIVAQYDVPDGLTPLEVGGIVNEKIKNKDISAEIIYLATRGYLKIKKIDCTKDNFLCLISKDDYEFTLLKEEGLLPDSFDKKIITALFEENGLVGGVVKLSGLKDSFYKSVPGIKNSVRNTLLSKKYYSNLPKLKTPAGLIFLIFWFMFLPNIFGISAGNSFDGFLYKFVLSISIILSLAIFFIFNHLMPAKTKKGVFALEYLLGLKEYLQIAEKDRLYFHNAPDKKPEIFETLLPYAMVFGVEELWAKEFSGVYINPPDWYEGSNNFSVVGFGRDMALFNTLAVSSFSSPSSSGGMGGSGGGGFSGGGGGGGGGGSW